MARADVDVQAVKDALSSGNASSSTASALQLLLGLHASSGPQAIRKGSVAANAAAAVKLSSAQNAKTISASKRKVQIVPVHEDVPGILSPRETYALATETVNICLKVLTDSGKAVSQGRMTATSARNPTTASPLQPRSGNTTPVRRSPGKAKGSRVGLINGGNDVTEEPSPHVVAMAECARLSFSFLRSVDPQKLGIRETPMLQLETGMLALIGNLIAYGLESMAIKELRTVKRSLEALLDSKKNAKTAKPLRARNAESSEKKTLASLLRLSGDFDLIPDALQVAITYQAHVLRVVSTSRKVAVIEELHKYLLMEVPNSPVDLIIRQVKHSGYSTKAAKQLESLSHTILGLCPSVALAAYEAAVNSKQSPSPSTVLALQVLALRTRRVWWKLTKHQANIEKELLDPFLKCASAFVRRQSRAVDAEATYELLCSYFEDIGPFDSATDGMTLFSIHKLLCTHSERAGLHETALKWADEQVRDCSSLEPSHARRISALLKKIALQIQGRGREEKDANLTTIRNLLTNDLNGSGADYDLLLATLADLLRYLSFGQNGPESGSWTRLTSHVASFALRFCRSYPEKSAHHVQTIVDVALRWSSSGDDLLAWVTQDAARVYIQAGALEAVAATASTKPLSVAWSASRNTISLSRILRTLLLRALRDAAGAKTTLGFDDDQLEPAERGAILELQLQYTIEVASKTKYHSVLQCVLPEVLRRLSKIYGASEFPVRRARVVIMAFKLRESHPEMTPPHLFKIWHDCAALDEGDLGDDNGLRTYARDLNASLAVARAFADGQPTIEDLESTLLDWQLIADSSDTHQALCDKIDDPLALVQQLKSIAAYLGMLGEDGVQLATQRLLVRIQQLHNDTPSTIRAGLVGLAVKYLDLGLSEKAGNILAQTQIFLLQEEVSGLVKLEFHVAYADYLLFIDNLDKCRASLDEARKLRSDLAPDQISRGERRQYELLHAHVYLVQSKYMLDIGSPHDALAAAKRSVMVLNGIWFSCERATGRAKPELVVDTGGPSESNIDTLAKGVSKLQLIPKEGSISMTVPEQNRKGAAFWAIVPLLSKALMHLSDMYTHHGLFNEADYYSERAIGIAESVGSIVVLSRTRSHRARLLTLAGRLNDAELCLAQDRTQDSATTSLAAIERCIAKAEIRVKEDSLKEALALYEEAESMLEDLNSDAYLTKIERFDKEAGEMKQCIAGLSLVNIAAQAVSTGSTTKEIKKAGRKPAKAAALKRLGATSAMRPKATRQPEPPEKRPSSTCSVHSKLKTNILLSKALVGVRLGHDFEATLMETEQVRCSTSASLQRRQLQHERLMRKATEALEMDVIFNILAESTVSFPALINPDRRPPDAIALHPGLVRPAEASKLVVVKTSTKPDKKKAGSEFVFWDLLDSARDCLMKGHAPGVQFHGTAQIHKECALLSNATLLLSAIPQSRASNALNPVREGLTIDLPRVRAWQSEREAIVADGIATINTDLLTWPEPNSVASPKGITTANFQEQYIDILPSSWTAVSLCLSEDASELYIARYRSDQSPLILRLPFSRHKLDGMEEEAFDYHKGKAELQEIIGLSNYSCHSSGDLEAKGAKTNWWSEREALDRRLHELLINIENIWFGGFRAVFSWRARQTDLLARFQKSFDEILHRYLPSRKAGKGRNETLMLDDKVLDLFTGLGNDQKGAIDLDESIADLLYFVVDMLQFNGERNAYDEIDFDSMAIDVLDALRAYHEACADSNKGAHHLVLVLDRRLQAFPWESMPYLDGASVSRVGSMISLRECIVAMRKARSEGDCHQLSRASGAYILNPSSDLPGTQTTLSPALSSLTKIESSDWTSIIEEEPSEDRFTSLLTTSSMLLYFGHGAGAQYVRPRTIKRLGRCCDVVWLMGCSSGAMSEYGELEPCAVPLAYLLAGEQDNTSSGPQSDRQESGGKCMAVVATLWDVTDKDIDRFSLAVGEEWGLWVESEQNKVPAKTQRKREIIAAPSTPQQVPKTPKTPKVRKTPAPAKTPARSRSRPREDKGRKLSLVEAVARSRDTCYLKYLNGAAPVVYGVPVYLGN